VTGPPDGDRRLHPLTPLLRGWAVVAAVLFFVVRNLHDLSQDITPDRVGLGLLLLVPAALVYGFLSWRFTRYRIEPDRLRLQSGVLFRRTRHLRLDRLQSVDIVRPFAARLTGLAVLRFDLAGGERDTSTLQYLTLAQAVELRDELLSRASGADPAAPRSPDQVLFSLSTGRLLASIALTLGPWASLVLIGVAFLPTLVNDSVTGLIAALPVLAGFWHTTFRRFAESYGFTVTESPDGLRISSGLVNSRHHTNRCCGGGRAGPGSRSMSRASTTPPCCCPSRPAPRHWSCWPASSPARPSTRCRSPRRRAAPAGSRRCCGPAAAAGRTGGCSSAARA
jgi:putative membrane protein